MIRLGCDKNIRQEILLIPNSQNIETRLWQVPAINRFGRTWQVGNSPNLAPRTTLHAVVDKMPLQTHFLLHLFLLSFGVAQSQGFSGDNEELPAGLPPVLEDVDNSCPLTHECIPKVEWTNRMYGCCALHLFKRSKQLRGNEFVWIGETF